MPKCANSCKETLTNTTRNCHQMKKIFIMMKNFLTRRRAAQRMHSWISAHSHCHYVLLHYCFPKLLHHCLNMMIPLYYLGAFLYSLLSTKPIQLSTHSTVANRSFRLRACHKLTPGILRTRPVPSLLPLLEFVYPPSDMTEISLNKNVDQAVRFRKVKGQLN
jgi:hypothetical protein